MLGTPKEQNRRRSDGGEERAVVVGANECRGTEQTEQNGSEQLWLIK